MQVCDNGRNTISDFSDVARNFGDKWDSGSDHTAPFGALSYASRIGIGDCNSSGAGPWTRKSPDSSGTAYNILHHGYGPAKPGQRLSVRAIF